MGQIFMHRRCNSATYNYLQQKCRTLNGGYFRTPDSDSPNQQCGFRLQFRRIEDYCIFRADVEAEHILVQWQHLVVVPPCSGKTTETTAASSISSVLGASEGDGE
jgi:hypothetical protein